MTPIMRVIATAGHVDHGKSALVEALTGTHPDRLKEEREREMTIDLGFGYFTLPDGTRVGIVDVPGHRDFIDNMLSGVGGVDAALLVIAADEGPMPQTAEHLAILDLLGIGAGVVALTKIDLIRDPQWLDMVRKDIADLLSPAALRGAEIIPVSARTGAGVPELKQALMNLLRKCPPRPDLGRPRLPIDRVFSLPGFGTIVTGTLIDGSLRTGEDVEIHPSGKSARIRGLQSHGEKIETAGPGSRVAANLTGVEPSEIRRGQVVVRPGTYSGTKLLDLRVRMLADVESGLRHNGSVKLYLGAAEAMARIRVLGSDAIAPGTTGWAQLALAGEIVAARGDRVILRRPSPGATIGGGAVLDAHPEKMHRRFDPAVAARLEALAKGDPEEWILQAIPDSPGATLADAVRSAGLQPETAGSAVARLLDRGDLILLSGDPAVPENARVCSRSAWERWKRDAAELLALYHGENPLRGAMPREELRSRLKIHPKALAPMLARAESEGVLEETARGVKLPGHVPKMYPEQSRAAESLRAWFGRDPFNPPSVKDCVSSIGKVVFDALVENGTLMQLSDDVVFLQSTYEEMADRIRRELAARGKLTVAETRDLFGSSRKYMLALLGYLDAQGITRRDGDYRMLK
jgi:selenocysteine-specific elongation factor